MKHVGYPNNILRTSRWGYNGSKEVAEDFLFPDNVSLSGTATTRATTSGNLSVVVLLSGTASVRITTAATLYVGVVLTGVSSTRITTAGNITHIPVVVIEGKASTRIRASGNLTVEGFGARLARATLHNQSEFWYYQVEPAQ
jgi:hypothetical protein